MSELADVPGAFGYGDSILAGERVRLRVEAPQDVAVYRGEVIEHLHEAARDALSSIVPPAE